MIYILIALSIISIYLGIMLFKIKLIPTSISNTYYLGGKDWFSITLILVGLFTTAGLLSISPTSFMFLGFLTGAGLMFVGAASEFKKELTKQVHITGALIFGICSQLWVAIVVNPWILIIWSLMIPVYIFNKKNKTFWAEIICILGIIIGMILL